jgi:hypothetical protein
MKAVVYLMSFPSGAGYVGSTTRPARRFRDHRRTAVNQRVAAEMARHAPTFTVLASAVNPTEVHVLERVLIEQIKPSLNVNPAPDPIRAGYFITRPSYARAAARYGVSETVFWQRKHSGWTTMQALGLAPRPERKPRKMRPRLITAGGKTMDVKAWSRQTGLPVSTIHRRISDGWTPEQAVGQEPSKLDEKRAAKAERDARIAERKAKFTYTIDGFTGNLREICAHFGVSYPTANARRQKGLPQDHWLRGPPPGPPPALDDLFS